MDNPVHLQMHLLEINVIDTHPECVIDMMMLMTMMLMVAIAHEHVGRVMAINYSSDEL